MESIRDRTRRLLAGRQPRLIAGGGLVPAAVLLLLYERAGCEHVLFQVRTQQVLHHRGEIGLPGGRRDPQDDSLLATALRETEEEIGVGPADVEVLGRLDDAATRSTRFSITPFVAAVTREGPYPFRMAEREVQQLLEVPLDHLRDEQSVSWAVNEVDGEAVAERSFRYGEHLIWGATARIIGQYLDLLNLDLPPGADDAQGATGR